MIYLVDMDGVLADTINGFNRRWQEMFPEKSFVPYEKITKFKIEECYPKESRHLVDKVWSSDGFFNSLEPIKGALDGIRSLAETENVFICTCPLTNSKDCVQDKWNWVKEYLGIDWAKKLIITKDKTVIYGNILIDDQPEINGVKEPMWEHIIYDHPWNRQTNGKRRMTWQNYRDVLGIKN